MGLLKLKPKLNLENMKITNRRDSRPARPIARAALLRRLDPLFGFLGSKQQYHPQLE